MYSMGKLSYLFSVAVLLEHSLISCMATTVTDIANDRSALLALKANITFDPHHVLEKNWSKAYPICKWIGVTCSIRHHRVTALNLPDMGLVGALPPEIGKLSFLVKLNVKNNRFHGNLPEELARLRRLKSISFGINNFDGEVPPWLGALTELRELLLYNNSFMGSIPVSMGNLTKLETMDLKFNHLTGEIPQELGNLQKLKSLDMEGNRIMGSIPLSIFNMSALQCLDFTNNSLSGSLPEDMCRRLPKLRQLYLPWNKLDGPIPSRLYLCSEFQVLSLYNNKFSGSIPREIGNLTRLQVMYLDGNKLTGVIPEEIGNLHKLEELILEVNSLSGSIPASIFNISTLTVLSLSTNHLTGNLPASTGQMLPNLEFIFLGINNLSGIIPESISNASKLQHLDLSSNSFMGSVPNSLGNLRFLDFLDLESNSLSGGKSEFSELSFFTSLTNCRVLRVFSVAVNPLNGVIPVSVGNLSTSLQYFIAGSCKLRGKIPSEIGNISDLAFLSLADNDLTGPIPTTVADLRELQKLDLPGNKIKGSIPNDLCNLENLGGLYLSRNQIFGPISACLKNMTSLRYLYLDSNRLTSTIPMTLWSLNYLLELNLSSNSLSGSLPPEVGNLKVVTLLDLSMNQFSGSIPSTIGGMQYLINLSLAYNRLEGTIPESLGTVLSLQLLDLSHNNLSGAIPKSLEALTYLEYLNVSFNGLRGEIPSGGPFRNLTNESFMFNEALCGGSSRFHLPLCPPSSLHGSRIKKWLRVVYIMVPIGSVVAAIAIIYVLIRHRKRQTPSPQTEMFPVATSARISHHELLLATDGFSETNLLGSGSFGEVYKGILQDGTLTAVKVFNLQHEGALASFDKECEVLRNLRHRNLTKVISSCCNLDFKAVILEYMPNGSLEKWLYSHNYFLDVLQRLEIMTDVACALEYLHHGYSTPVVHCDLKPSNVLLDEDMVARISDFGIAKMLSEESVAQTKTFATLGYIAPEYGSGGLVSTRCDVYSYGIMLLETFTRTKPNDEIFAGDLSLKHWVKDALPNGIVEVIDANLLRPEEAQFSGILQCVISIMELALNCSAESPGERMNMKDVLTTLKKIRLQLLPHYRRI